MPPNVTFAAPPEKRAKRAPARGRTRRSVVAVALPVLAIAAFAAGSLLPATTEVVTDQIQATVLAVVDGATGEPDAKPATGSSCHEAYVDCVPLDLTEDLDCGDLTLTDVRLHDANWDPYELDDNGDGIGCEGD